LGCESLEDRTVPSFLPPVSSPGTFNGVGDLNGDKRADLVVTDYDADTVAVRLGNGDGTFQPAGPAQVVQYLSGAVGVADFDGDDHVDVLAKGFGLNLLRGNGDGTIQRPVKTSVNRQITMFLVADMNNDGRPDAVARSYHFFLGNSWQYLDILLAQPNGSFEFTQSLMVGYDVCDHGCGVLHSPLSFHAGDFDGDGRQDVLTIASSTSNDAYPSRFLLGNGDGTVEIGPDVNQFVNVAVVVADLNRDRKADVVRKNTDGATSTVFIGKGDGQFTKTQRVSMTGIPVVADINRDRKPDLVSVNAGDGKVRVLLGKGDGKFQAPQDFATGLMPTSIAVGDFDGDGWLDVLAAGGGSLSVLLNDRLW
jgi:hypothetical protein